MSKYTTVEEQIEYGLDSIDPNEKIEMSLKDLMYLHQTILMRARDLNIQSCPTTMKQRQNQAVESMSVALRSVVIVSP